MPRVANTSIPAHALPRRPHDTGRSQVPEGDRAGRTATHLTGSSHSDTDFRATIAGMRRSLSLETFVTALAVLSLDAVTTGCTSKEHAAAAPEPAVAPVPPPAPQQPAKAPGAVANEAPAQSNAAVDAGVERAKAPAPSKGASASCGAQGCSADMKKLGK